MSIKVLIVDDSALVRQMLTEMQTSGSEIAFVGVTPDPRSARDETERLGAADRQLGTEDMAAAVLDTARVMDRTVTYQAIEV